MEEDAGTGRRKPTDADGSPEELNTTAHAGFGRFRNAGGRHDPRHQPATPKRDDSISLSRAIRSTKRHTLLRSWPKPTDLGNSKPRLAHLRRRNRSVCVAVGHELSLAISCQHAFHTPNQVSVCYSA